GPGHAAVVVHAAPPAGLSPAEVGTVLDESADLSDLTATIVDLAVQGYLRIEEFETRTFHFFTNRDYTLTKLREPEGRKEHERELMTALFAGGASVKASDLRERFYARLPAIRRALYRELSRGDDRCFASN